MRTALSVAVLVLGTLPAGSVRSDEPTELRWRFTKGAQPAYTLSQDISTTMDAGGQKIETSQSAVFGYTYEVTSTEDDVAQIDMTYDRVRIAMKTPVGNVEYDSGDPGKGSAQGGQLAGLFEVFDALVGEPLKISLAKDGRLEKLDMPQAVSEKLSNVPGPMAGSFGEDGMRQTVSLAFLPTPSTTVKTGDTWSRQSEVTSPMGKMVYDVKYTYLATETVAGANLDKIGVETNVSLEPSPESPFDVKIKNQKSEGTALFDNKAGRLHSFDEVVKMDLEVSVAGNSMVQSLEMAYKIAQGKGQGKPDAAAKPSPDDSEK